MRTRTIAAHALLASALLSGVTPFMPRFAYAQDAPLGGTDSNTRTAQTADDDPSDAADTLVIDDFEAGVSAWSLNDPDKVRDPAAGAVLVGAVPVKADNSFLPDSRGAGLFTFKAGRKSWASASRRVNGATWAQIGAQRLAFYLSGDENLAPDSVRGVDLLLRAHPASGAKGPDEVFRLPLDPLTRRPKLVLLNRRDWRRVAIPLSAFRSPRGPLDSAALRRLYLVQFAQSGTWDSRFFSLDQLQIEGSGEALPATAPPPAAPPNPAADPNAIAVTADFLALEGRIAASANVSIGTARNSSGAPDRAPLDAKNFREAIGTLKPGFVRLDAGQLCDLTDSSAPAFDFTRLKTAAGRVKSLGALPLVAITNPPAWALDEHGYALFARGAALALNGRAAPVARYWELSGEGVTFYNAARAALRAVNPGFRVGGEGLSTRDGAALRALLGGASGMEFLSVSDFGATGDEGGDSFVTARSAARLRAVALALHASRFRNAALYVTQANPRAAQDDADSGAAGRLTGLSAAAWWAAYLGSASRVANQVFHEDASDPDAGLLTSESSAYPAYYAMYLWNTFFPGGSRRVKAGSANPAIAVAAANTATAHNLLLVNTSASTQTVQVSIRGFPVLRAARMQLLESAASSVRYVALPKSAFQTIKLRPYAVAVVQFIEGRRKR